MSTTPRTKRDELGHAVTDLVATLRISGMPSARNLLVTVFGDAVAPHDAAVPVQALVQLLAGVGVNDRLVRTSLTRLVRDGILRNEKIGRRSIYAIDPASLSLFEHADNRIYVHRELDWDGDWTLAVVDATASTTAGRTRLRRELTWLGMGTVAPNVLASPNLDPAAITSMLDRLGDDHHVLVTRGAATVGASTMSDEEIARRFAPVDDLSARYAQIIDWFDPIVRAFDQTDDPSPQDCWTARLLLIATFRRIALVDPALPEKLLPDTWNGATARDLVGSLYERIHEHAERWLAEVCVDPVTAWGPPAGRLDRFV